MFLADLSKSQKPSSTVWELLSDKHCLKAKDISSAVNASNVNTALVSFPNYLLVILTGFIKEILSCLLVTWLISWLVRACPHEHCSINEGMKFPPFLTSHRPKSVGEQRPSFLTWA